MMVEQHSQCPIMPQAGEGKLKAFPPENVARSVFNGGINESI
jgi:hypothetical protein